MKAARVLSFDPLPDVLPTVDWGLRAPQLNADPAMVRLTRGYWFHKPEHYEPAMLSVLLHRHFRRNMSGLPITGLHALRLYKVPVDSTQHWINPTLGHEPAPRARAFVSAMGSPHLAWNRYRPTSELGGATLTKSYGLNPYLGPSECALTHPIEALTVAAPYLSAWRIIACLDYLLAHRIQVTNKIWLKPFDREEISRTLALLPPRSRSACRIARLLSHAVERTWSSPETLTRLLVLKNGFPPPSMNPLVMLDGRERFPDLAWVAKRTALEYNSNDHAIDTQIYRDENYRLERFRDAGWKVRVLTWDDLRHPARRAQWMCWLDQQLR